MKKVLSVLLVLCMLLPVAALAESVDYTHEGEPAYSLTLPADWVVISKETADSLLSLGLEALGDDQLAQYATLAQQMDMVYILSADGSKNINVIAQQLGVEVEAAQLYELLSAALVAQLQQQLPGISFISEGEVVTLGENEMVRMLYSAEIGGQPMSFSQYLVPCGEYMLTVTATVGGTMDDATLASLDAIIATLAY